MSKCQVCARCAYVSLSLAQRDCSWYSECDLSDLRPSPPGAAKDYVTVQVKEAAAPVPKAAAGASVQVAVVSLEVGRGAGKHMLRCGIVQWCVEAQRYAAAINTLAGFNASVVVIGRRHSGRGRKAGFDPADCPGAAAVVESDPRVEAAMRACPSHQRASWHPSMLKWAVVGWTQYD